MLISTKDIRFAAALIFITGGLMFLSILVHVEKKVELDEKENTRPVKGTWNVSSPRTPPLEALVDHEKPRSNTTGVRYQESPVHNYTTHPSFSIPHFQVPSILNNTLAVPDKAGYQQSFFDDMSVDSPTPKNLLVNTESAKSDAEFDHGQNSAIQVKLWNLQHPQNCDTAKLLVLSEFHHSGFGSTLHIRALQFMMGLDYKRVVVDDPGMFWEQTSQQKEYCKSTSS